MIPKLLIQTSLVELPPHIPELLASRLGEGWHRLHFTDKDIIEFFKSNPLDELPHVVDVFNSMPRGEHKADLFRYYYLYINGGVYIDSDAMLYTDIKSIVRDYDFFSALSFIDGTIFQGFLGAAPRNEIIRRALTDAYLVDVDQLRNHYHLLCYNLHSIILNAPAGIAMTLYREVEIDEYTSAVLDERDQIILLHFHRHPEMPGPLSLRFAPHVYRCKRWLCRFCRLERKGDPQIPIRRVAEFFLTLGRATRMDFLCRVGDTLWKVRFF